jgi:hypothetical protein
MKNKTSKPYLEAYITTSIAYTLPDFRINTTNHRQQIAWVKEPNCQKAQELLQVASQRMLYNKKLLSFFDWCFLEDEDLNLHYIACRLSC